MGEKDNTQSDVELLIRVAEKLPRDELRDVDKAVNKEFERRAQALKDRQAADERARMKIILENNKRILEEDRNEQKRNTKA